MSEEIIKIFYSYSRRDLDMRNRLENHLAALRKANKISTWHDLELEAGTEWEPAILNKLDTADIILLLVSSDFIASEYCYGTELKRAISRHDDGEARVIPIILRPCDWNHSDVPFSKLNVLPTHAKAITSWVDQQEEAFTIVAQRIRETVDQLRTQKRSQKAEKQLLLAQKEAVEKAEKERIQQEQKRQAEERRRLSQAEFLKRQEAEAAEPENQQELRQQRFQEQQLRDKEVKQSQADLTTSNAELTDKTLIGVDQELPDLPSSYGESRIVLMPRDPQWAYTYWDVTNEHKQSLREQGGQVLVLRLYDVTSTKMVPQETHSVQEYPCDELAREWYLPISVSDRDYLLEIGYRCVDGHLLVIASSAPVRIPPAYPSDWVEDLTGGHGL